MPARTTKSIPVREAAERLGVSRQRVHFLIKQGRLKASPKRKAVEGRVFHPKGVWVSVQSIEDFEARRRAREQGGGSDE